MTEGAKVEILLKAVGDAPILKQNKWTVDEKKTVAELSIFLRNYMKVSSFLPVCFSAFPADCTISKFEIKVIISDIQSALARDTHPLTPPYL